MARKKGMSSTKLGRWISIGVNAFVGLGVGGLFVTGGFENVPILEIFGPLVHDVVGWLIIAGTAIALVSPLFDN